MSIITGADTHPVNTEKTEAFWDKTSNFIKTTNGRYTIVTLGTIALVLGLYFSKEDIKPEKDINNLNPQTPQEQQVSAIMPDETHNEANTEANLSNNKNLNSETGDNIPIPNNKDMTETTPLVVSNRSKCHNGAYKLSDSEKQEKDSSGYVKSLDQIKAEEEVPLNRLLPNLKDHDYSIKTSYDKVTNKTTVDVLIHIYHADTIDSTEDFSVAARKAIEIKKKAAIEFLETNGVDITCYPVLFHSDIDKFLD